MKKLLFTILSVVLIAVFIGYYCVTQNQSGLTIVAAGDIAHVNGRHVDVAGLIEKINPEKILLLGDSVYDAGTTEEYATLYHPSWGAFKDKTAPSPGNHEYKTTNAAGYYKYFGSLAGPDGRGYYSFDIDTWHIISLNSEVVSEAQLAWLEEDLEKNSKPCILAYWHKPLFSSGKTHGPNTSVKAFWDKLYTKGADIVLNGHEHFYERFAKLNPEGSETSNGIRQITVGTGGAPQYDFANPLIGSEVRLTDKYGVLELTLKENSYRGKFKTIDNDVVDRIEGTCN